MQLDASRYRAPTWRYERATSFSVLLLKYSSISSTPCTTLLLPSKRLPSIRMIEKPQRETLIHMLTDRSLDFPSPSFSRPVAASLAAACPSHPNGKPSTTGMAEPAFYVEDICRPRSGLGDGVVRSAFGVVIATHTDLDSHGTQPDPNEKHHRDIPTAEYRRFQKTGIPPKGAVLIEWGHIEKLGFSELIPTKHLELVDRALLVGDFVKRRNEDVMSGTVVGTSVKCTIMPLLYRPNYNDPSVLSGRNPFTKGSGAPTLVYEALLGTEYLVHDVSPPREAILSSIPAEELKRSRKYQQNDLVIYRDWVGLIDNLSDGAKLICANNQIKQVDHDRFRMCKPRSWLTAEMPELLEYPRLPSDPESEAEDASVPAVGFIADTTPTWIDVRWLCRRVYSDPSAASFGTAEPPITLYRDVLESGDLHVYDERCLAPNADPYSSMRTDLVQNDRVQFRKLSEAAAKYDGKASSNHLRPIDPSYTRGYDLNVFEVRGTETSVRVLWQDQSITECRSVELIPDINHEDESSFQPGEIVISHEKKVQQEEQWIFEPTKVGVVQKVNATDRIAQVRWFSGASVKYARDVTEIDEAIGFLPGSTTGSRTKDDEYEDISVYDIQHAPGLNKHRGDMVILHPPASESNFNQGQGIDWFGEVTELGLDGLLTVRLGALDTIRDVQIAPEYALLTSTADLDPMDEEFDDEDGYDDWDDWGDEMDDYETGLVNLLTPEVREIFYVDGNGNRVRVEDKTGEMEQDDDWSTEDEHDGDEELPDLPSQGNGVTTNIEAQDAEIVGSSDTEMQDAEDQAAPLIASKPSEEPQQLKAEPKMEQPIPGVAPPDNSPPHFAVLDSPVPLDHGFFGDYVECPSHVLRRIHKEHKILLSSLPSGIYVRSWESRLDLFRVLIVGPDATPYEFAPFIIDLRVPFTYPTHPPEAYFHSWTHRSYGPVNPNLYENGKICLSLLGTWDGEEKHENWSPARSNLLQVLISIQGLVLVREPYYNEAGYEVRAGSEESKVPSRIYSEKIYFVARAFVAHALKHGVDGFADVLKWLYTSEDEQSPKLLAKAIEAAKGLIRSGDKNTAYETGGLSGFSKGALVMLKRQLNEMEKLVDPAARHQSLC